MFIVNEEVLTVMYSIFKEHKSRQVVVNCKAKKKQHAYASLGLHDHYSELFTQMTALNFLNAVAKPLLQLSLTLLQI